VEGDAETVGATAPACERVTGDDPVALTAATENLAVSPGPIFVIPTDVPTTEYELGTPALETTAIVYDVVSAVAVHDKVADDFPAAAVNAPKVTVAGALGTVGE
jgi:hypothetical protein